MTIQGRRLQLITFCSHFVQLLNQRKTISETIVEVSFYHGTYINRRLNEQNRIHFIG